MRRFSFIAIIIMTFATTAVAFDSTAVVRIGYIDKQLFIKSMPEMQNVEAELKKLKAEYDDEFQSMTNEYNERVKNYLKQKSNLSEAIKLARQTEITEMESMLDLYRRRYLNDLEQKRKVLTTPIVEAVDDAIKAVARSLALTLVFDQATPIYISDDCVDITDAVSVQLGLK